MPEYLKWAHTAVLKATVIRSKATLLYALSIVGKKSEIDFLASFLDGLCGILVQFMVSYGHFDLQK